MRACTCIVRCTASPAAMEHSAGDAADPAQSPAQQLPRLGRTGSRARSSLTRLNGGSESCWGRRARPVRTRRAQRRREVEPAPRRGMRIAREMLSVGGGARRSDDERRAHSSPPSPAPRALQVASPRASSSWSCSHGWRRARWASSSTRGRWRSRQQRQAQQQALRTMLRPRCVCAPAACRQALVRAQQGPPPTSDARWCCHCAVHRPQGVRGSALTSPAGAAAAAHITAGARSPPSAAPHHTPRSLSQEEEPLGQQKTSGERPDWPGLAPPHASFPTLRSSLCTCCRGAAPQAAPPAAAATPAQPATPRSAAANSISMSLRVDGLDTAHVLHSLLANLQPPTPCEWKPRAATSALTPSARQAHSRAS